MTRWAPNARERLQSAALDLFVENGYEQTTVAQIAERAGLNRATFFRHFADKREALFGGEEALAELFATGIQGAEPDATPLECLYAALSAVDRVMTSQQRTLAAQRLRVLANHPDLQERGLLKYARITASVTTALQKRGVDELTARLGAEVALLAFRIAFERWMKADGNEPFSSVAETTLSELRARTTALL